MSPAPRQLAQGDDPGVNPAAAGTSLQGYSSHGTIIRRETTPGGPMVPIAEVGDITLPGLSRNEHETTSHNKDIDAYVGGVLRRVAPTFPLFFNMNEPSHDHLTGLYSAIIANAYEGYEITQPDGFRWLFSGFVQNIAPTAPVDGVQTANVTIRPSGPMYINDVLVGAPAV
jgi:hypothetical protein